MRSRCRFCRLPNPLRAAVEQGLGDRSMSFRRASKMTGIALSRLHHHITRHWTPPSEEALRAVPETLPTAESARQDRPYTSPCVIEMVDQMALARLRNQTWPKAYDLQSAWAAIFKPPKPPSVLALYPHDEALPSVSLDDLDLDV